MKIEKQKVSKKEYQLLSQIQSKKDLIKNNNLKIP